ncbi:unnamed protein product [Moneuplotes crassus]|uniref:Uncharacterized protein n=1 Tax=Euplotes crassus TaxID=5936 RepID=A0AAD1ULI1_EUPCR|nr:unnamed protein product [Moneuplotes crassus]
MKKGILESDYSCLRGEHTPSQTEESCGQIVGEDGKIYQQGRWTQYEHLIFLACIIHFGRDWKKIEYHVQTRSASQARSHAQKVLKKMDRNAIMREIRQIKNKLNFDPKIHKCDNLTVLTIDGDNWRDIPGLMPARYRRNRKNKSKIASTPQTKIEFQILKNAQKDMDQENKQGKGTSFSLTTPDVKDTSKEVKSCPPKQIIPKCHMVTRGKALTEAFKASELTNTPQPKLYREASTPSTVASTQASPVESEQKLTFIEEESDSSTAQISKVSSPSCFKNLSSRIQRVETNSKSENNSTSTSDASNEEIYFDFDFQPFFRNDKVDIEFENLISLNSIQTEHKAFGNTEHSFDNNCLFGDSIMPLSVLY